MPAPMQKNTWHPVYSSPPRQARPEPREPPPAPRKPPKQSTRRWADYEDDEPLEPPPAPRKSPRHSTRWDTMNPWD